MGDPLPLSERTRGVIGANGVSRLEEFASYPPNWGFDGREKPMEVASVARLDAFILAHEEWLGEDVPSVFLNREGFVVLAWDDQEGSRIEVEFTNPPLLYREWDDVGTPLEDFRGF